MIPSDHATLRQLRHRGYIYLKEYFDEQTALRDAELLLRKALGLSRASFFAHINEEPVSDVDFDIRYHTMLQRRAEYMPMQYLLGEQEFYGMKFLVRPGVLIPRPETELLVEMVSDHLSKRWTKQEKIHLGEVGVGSGVIGITLASLFPKLWVHGSDIAEEPVLQARENADLLGVSNRVHIFQGDLLAPLPFAQYHVLVSNPPYIPERDLVELAPDVQREPHVALFGGPDGLRYYHRLLTEGHERLYPQGFLAVEVGKDQAAVLQNIAEHIGWRLLDMRIDFNGIARTLLWEKQETFL